MKREHCRLCGVELNDGPVYELRGMPGGAQAFLRKEELSLDRGDDIVLYYCRSCGLLQITGEPVPYYKDVIRATEVSGEMRKYRQKQFNQFISKYGLEKKKIIEIGACFGDYLEIMSSENVEAYGLENSEKSVRLAEKKGLKMIRGFVEDEHYRIDGAPYDAFYIMNFLEHIPKPGAFLRGIANNLSDDAMGIVEVPNFDMIQRESLYSEFIRDHLSYFTEESLRGALSMSGFDVLTLEPIWHDYILSATVHKRKKLNLSGMDLKKKKIRDAVDHYIISRKRENKKIAVWGAGHQALATIALLDISDDLEVVLDSASFKQHLYTPATHLKVVGPEKMREYGIGAVIIMAGSYSDEIADIMEKEYPDIEWVILSSDGLCKKNHEFAS